MAGTGLGAQCGEIPAASAGMTELWGAGVAELGGGGVTELGRGYDGRGCAEVASLLARVWWVLLAWGWRACLRGGGGVGARGGLKLVPCGGLD